MQTDLTVQKFKYYGHTMTGQENGDILIQMTANFSKTNGTFFTT